MADLSGKLTQMGDAVIDITVKDNFDRLVLDLKKALPAESITPIISSYMSKYDIIDELRKRISKAIREGDTKPSETILKLIDPATPLADLAKVPADYTSLEDYIVGLTLDSFDPPLTPLESTADDLIKIATATPQQIDNDPRHTGNIVTIKADALSSPSLKTWLLNNSVLYGFVIYDNYSLYYLGKEAIKNKLTTAGADGDSMLLQLVRRFLRKSSNQVITTTAASVISNTYPPPPPPPPTTVSTSTSEIKPKSNILNSRGMYTLRTNFKQIVLHHTEGYGVAPKIRGMFKVNPSNPFREVPATQTEISRGKDQLDGYFMKDGKMLSINESSAWWGGMQLFVGFDGVVEKAIDDYPYIRVNGSSDLNSFGIGIEIGSIGALKGTRNSAGQPSDFPWKWGSNNSLIAGYNSNKYIDKIGTGKKKVVYLGYVYNGGTFWDDITDLQVNGLKNIFNEIMSKPGGGAELRQSLVGKNVYEMIFGIPNPTQGANIVLGGTEDLVGTTPRFGGYDTNSYGIFSHARAAHGGGAHSDTFPSPNLVKMLIDNFGMKGTIPTPTYYSLETGAVIT